MGLAELAQLAQLAQLVVCATPGRVASPPCVTRPRAKFKMAAGNRWRIVGPLELLVLQPTPFCNLDCTYCYLPDRDSKRRMSDATLNRVFQFVFSSGIVEQGFTVVWHAGEPMVLPVAYYERAIEIAGRAQSRRLAGAAFVPDQRRADRRRHGASFLNSITSMSASASTGRRFYTIAIAKPAKAARLSIA